MKNYTAPPVQGFMMQQGDDVAIGPEFQKLIEKLAFDKLESELEAIAEGHVQPRSTPGGPMVANWILNKPKKYQGYGRPLYALLKTAHDEGKSKPTARDVLEAWSVKKPPEIAQVLANGFDYYDKIGNTKGASLDAITEAIGRMTRQTHE